MASPTREARASRAGSPQPPPLALSRRCAEKLNIRSGFSRTAPGSGIAAKQREEFASRVGLAAPLANRLSGMAGLQNRPTRIKLVIPQFALSDMLSAFSTQVTARCDCG